MTIAITTGLAPDGTAAKTALKGFPQFILSMTNSCLNHFILLLWPDRYKSSQLIGKLTFCNVFFPKYSNQRPTLHTKSHVHVLNLYQQKMLYTWDELLLRRSSVGPIFLRIFSNQTQKGKYTHITPPHKKLVKMFFTRLDFTAMLRIQC